MDPVSQHPQRRRINVAARLRPLDDCAVEYEASWTVDASGKSFKELRSGDCWTFDHAFGPEVDNAGVFDACCADVIKAFCGGVNGTIVTYGQTASGKTHTMHGPEGVVPRAVEEVFSIISENSRHRQFLLTASYVEIYNEQVVDLLSGGEVITMEGQNGLVLQNLTHIAISCPEDVLDAVALGEQRRRIGETSANKRSSRSHVLLRLGLESRVDGESSLRYSQLNLGDLAGSEGLRNVELTSREQRREGSCINKSLLALSQVVQALSEGGGRGQRVSFRHSKLTRILQPSLGGNARTVIICTVSPNFASRAESRSTLDFAARARRVENSISVNIRRDGHQDSQIRALEKQLSALRDRVSSLRMSDEEEKTANEAKELSEENAVLRRKIERLEAAMLGGPAIADSSASSNASGKRRRRTIACGAEKEHAGLSETTVRDFMLQLPEGSRHDASLSEFNFPQRADVSLLSLCSVLETPREKMQHGPVRARRDSVEETPIANLQQSLTCPRLGVITPVATPQRTALRQPGFLSHRPLRCSSPPKRAEIKPITICFSPMSLLSVDDESPARRCELGSISQIEPHDSLETLDDLREEAEGQILLLQGCKLQASGVETVENIGRLDTSLTHELSAIPEQKQTSSFFSYSEELKSCESADLSHSLHTSQSTSVVKQLRQQAPDQHSQCFPKFPDSIEAIVRLVQRSTKWTCMGLALAHWRIALAESKARQAKEKQSEMLRQFERCTCGERQILDVRVAHTQILDARARGQRHRRQSTTSEDEAERNPPLFPAGAGAFGTLLKTHYEGHV